MTDFLKDYPSGEWATATVLDLPKLQAWADDIERQILLQQAQIADLGRRCSEQRATIYNLLQALNSVLTVLNNQSDIQLDLLNQATQRSNPAVTSREDINNE